MSVSSKSGAAHVRPVDDDFKVDEEQGAAPEGQAVTEPVAEAPAAKPGEAAPEAQAGAPAPKRRKFVMPVVVIAALAAGVLALSACSDEREPTAECRHLTMLASS